MGSQLVPRQYQSIEYNRIRIKIEEHMRGTLVPAVVVDLVAVARCVDNVQAEADTVLLDDYSHVVSRRGPHFASEASSTSFTGYTYYAKQSESRWWSARAHWG
jgi:hypothetical protein